MLLGGAEQVVNRIKQTKFSVHRPNISDMSVLVIYLENLDDIFQQTLLLIENSFVLRIIGTVRNNGIVPSVNTRMFVHKENWYSVLVRGNGVVALSSSHIKFSHFLWGAYNGERKLNFFFLNL